ncbi:MAG: pilus assembly protein, partial [Solirubrobacterales bacterium]|nr:pilus assembly protein [Solirubrobacterales bacterium]
GVSGQATVEFAGLLPLLVLVLVLVWQVVLVGMTYVFASHAARAGARALAVSDPVDPAAVKDLPAAWRGGTVVSPSPDDHGYRSVEVKVKLPVLIPGVLDLPVTIDSSAGTVIEDELLQAESGGTIGSGLVAFGSGRDPIPGFTIGRDDWGVDACATPGQPIFAPAPSILVDVIQEWTGPFDGLPIQPLLLFKFNPPLPGTPLGDQYWYVAEQITPVTEQTGTPFLAHQAVATFAPSGSCIEMGWGAPNSHGTLASETDTGAANPPQGATTVWGESFKQYFGIP